MVLLHEPVQVVDEPFTRILGVLEVPSDVDGLDGANLLAHAAEYAAELVDLEYDGVSVALIVLATDEPDTISRTHRRTEAAGHALGTSIGVYLHTVRAAPARTQLRLLLGVLLRHGTGTEHVTQGEPHSFRRSPKVRRLTGLRPMHCLDGYRHVDPPRFGMLISRRPPSGPDRIPAGVHRPLS